MIVKLLTEHHLACMESYTVYAGDMQLKMFKCLHFSQTK